MKISCWPVYKHFTSQESMTALSCMAHARRYFEAIKTYPEKREEILLLIAELYELEALAKEEELSPIQIYELRQEKALPVLDTIKQWLDTQVPALLPKSDLGKAVSYMLARGDSLVRYCEDGRYMIDNNWVENKIRPVAIGRKNWLFAGSHIGAQRSAVFYTLTANATLAGLNPERYLKNLIACIADHPMNKLDELLAHNIILQDI